MISSLCPNPQTFRAKKRFTQGTIRYSLHKQAQASLHSGINLRQVVKLPDGENLNDWVAVHGELFPTPLIESQLRNASHMEYELCI